MSVCMPQVSLCSRHAVLHCKYVCLCLGTVAQVMHNLNDPWTVTQFGFLIQGLSLQQLGF